MSDNIWGPFIGTSTGILTVLGTIYAAINHKKIVAKCCGKKFEFEIHVDEVKKNGNESTSVRVLPEESIQDVNHKKLTNDKIRKSENDENLKNHEKKYHDNSEVYKIDKKIENHKNNENNENQTDNSEVYFPKYEYEV